MPEAQNSRLPPGAVVQSLDSGPGAELRRNLSALASNPRSLDALIGAGRAAVTLRDGEAASGFFTRAQEIAPNDPRVKAGLASAMLLRERPEQALILFAEAVQRGAPEAEIAGDRGLAYDMVGDPRHAQQDYALALRHRGDPEIERRLALSLAISGQRDAALRVIDAQLRRQDRAGWRTQAFVLALTGDAAGADDTARRLMPPTNAQAMSPFFARLAALSPAQKAAAVNFGRFPSDGRATQIASNADTRADPGALAMAQSGAQQRGQYAEPAGDAQRRRPGLAEDPIATRIRTPSRATAPAPRFTQRFQVAQAQPRRFEPTTPPDPDDADQPDDNARQQESQSQRGPISRPREAPAFVPGGNFTIDTSHEERIPQPPVQSAPAQSAAPGFGSIDQTQTTPLRRFQPVPDPSRSAPVGLQPDTGNSFSDIAHVVRTLPDGNGDAARPAAPLSEAERQSRDAAAREAEARYRAGGGPAPARTATAHAGTGAGRHWVQIAHGAVRSALAVQYRQVHAQAPALLESHNAWTVADRSTNRLLVGPFDDEASARDYIDQLSQRQIAAIPWESAAGQSVDRLQGAGSTGASYSTSRVRQAQAARPAPATRSSRSRQAEERTAAQDRRASSRSRAGRAAATSDDDDRPTTRSRTGRGASAANDRSSSRSRSGRSAASDERSTSHGRSSTRDRAGADDRGNARTRSGRAAAADSRAASGRSTTRRGADQATTSGRSRTGHGRASADDDSHTSRSRSSQEHRPSAHDTRTSRGRSSEEQRPAPSRRRSH